MEHCWWNGRIGGIGNFEYLYKEDCESRTLYWEHMGNKAVREGDWKLVMMYGSEWELYNLREDPTELKDLSSSNREIVNKLKIKWDRWAHENGVKDWPVKKRNNLK